MTLTVTELKFRGEICKSCEFNTSGVCVKLDKKIRMSVFEPECPESKWEQSESYPKLKEQMKTFATSMASWLKNGLSQVPETIYLQRLDTCKGCEFWDGKALKGTGRCRKCGCSTWAKLKLPHEKCPVDKWGKYEE
jgi:hypothetical protein